MVTSAAKKIADVTLFGFYMKECRANIHHELHGSKKTSKSVSTLPRFLHRGTAGNMDPLTGGGAGMIRWSDR